MADREKVIRGLEFCKWSDAGRYDGYEPMYENCEKCPYNNEQDLKSECNNKLRQDVLFLLKEQELEEDETESNVRQEDAEMIMNLIEKALRKTDYQTVGYDNTCIWLQVFIDRR